jgi:hypothetical protein
MQCKILASYIPVKYFVIDIFEGAVHVLPTHHTTAVTVLVNIMSTYLLQNKLPIRRMSNHDIQSELTGEYRQIFMDAKL